jgi:undecaprenyl-diphosphatase
MRNTAVKASTTIPVPAVLGVVAAVAATLALSGGGGPLTAAKAIVLGVVEGVTEFLPVSSTGHLLVVQRLLGLGSGAGKRAADTYAVAIQGGAILAVVALYRERLGQLAAGLVGRDREGRRLLGCLVLAFVPAAVAGLAFDGTIKAHLFGVGPVIAAWAVGGLFLLRWRPSVGARTLAGMDLRSAAIIGVAQSLALWPGMSRSLVTLVAAVALGFELAAALEFSFLLGLATLGAATMLDLAKDGPTLVADYGWRTPLLGMVVAFAAALVAVRWLVSALRAHPLAIFGWYRVGAALAVAGLALAGVV